MRFVLFSDLHLDSAFAWAQRAVARRRRQALRDTLQRVVSLADAVDADALLCGGDLYEHERSTPDTAAFLRETFGAAGRPVYVAPGNHDWFGPDSLYAQVSWPSHVTVFTEAALTPVALADGLTLWGAAHRAPANTDGFLEGFTAAHGGVNIALFHGSERAGLAHEAEGKRPHAPFDAERIPASGLHHAFLGHHHLPREATYHTYPGNPDPLTFGEIGVRGAVVVDVDQDGTVRREWHSVNVSEVHDLVMDVTGCAHRDAIRERIVEGLAGRSGTARVTLTGELEPCVELDLEGLCDGEHDLDQVVLRTGALSVGYDLDAIAAEQTVRGRFVRDVRAAPDLHGEERRRVLLTGLRALEAREDLEVV